MENIDKLIESLELATEPELRWMNPEDAYIGCGDTPDELCQRAAACIRQLRKALQHILTHCKSDKPPNAQALILFANNALKGEE